MKRILSVIIVMTLMMPALPAYALWGNSALEPVATATVKPIKPTTTMKPNMTSDDEIIIANSSTRIYGDADLENNIRLAAEAINGSIFNRWDEFSFNNLVGPREELYGYKEAVNGRGVIVVGGGVAQVASTIYLSIKRLNCIEIIEKNTYGSNYQGKYVTDEEDAIMTDYNANYDFRFCYVGYNSLRINLYISDSILYCELYERELFNN